MRLSTPPTLPSLRKPAMMPTGPRIRPVDEIVIGGPGEPPAGFLNGQNSITEWIAYWALAKIFKNPRDADLRRPPFLGGWPDWEYQSPEAGGFMRALGSAVVDFLVHMGGTRIAIRIQTERFHIFTSSSRQAYDVIQRATLEHMGLRVIDVYDDQLLGDPSGQKAVIAMKRAIGLLENLNPVIGGRAIRASRLRPYG